MPKGGKSLGGFMVVLETSVPACLCACLCLPVPVACRQVFDARHNFTEEARPASKSRLVFPLYIFRIPQSLPGYPASAADYSQFPCCAKQSRLLGIVQLSHAWVRGDLSPSASLNSFSRPSMGPCSLLSYKVVAPFLFPVCSPLVRPF